MIKDAHSKQILYRDYVRYETIELYLKGIYDIESLGYEIKAIVCDGKLLRNGYYLTQMCHFHQIAIITRYLTQKPKLEASIELKLIVEKLTKISKKHFKRDLEEWLFRWAPFLKERTINPETNQWYYTHKRLRSAYRSLVRNFENLFVYQDYPDLEIPNTTNSLEGTFTSLKTKLRLHSGMSILHKKKFIDSILFH